MTNSKLERLKDLLTSISRGMTIPGYRGPHPDEQIAILQEVMHAAQTYAKEGLEIISSVTPDTEGK